MDAIPTLWGLVEPDRTAVLELVVEQLSRRYAICAAALGRRAERTKPPLGPAPWDDRERVK